MKKLMILCMFLLLGIGCAEEETCWICSIQKYVRINAGPHYYYYEWQDGGIEIFCQERKPHGNHELKYDCELL